MAMATKRRAKTDDDYRELDDAIGTLLKWETEIVDFLAARALGDRPYRTVLDALRRLHDGEE